MKGSKKNEIYLKQYLPGRVENVRQCMLEKQQIKQTKTTNKQKAHQLNGRNNLPLFDFLVSRVP